MQLDIDITAEALWICHDSPFVTHDWGWQEAGHRLAGAAVMASANGDRDSARDLLELSRVAALRAAMARDEATQTNRRAAA